MRLKARWIAITVFFVAAAAAGLWWREGPLPVAVVTPVRGAVVDAIYATGTVEPTVMLPISPRVAGKLVALNVDEGALVRKGQLLARIEDADLADTVQEQDARESYARSQYERTRSLVARGYLAQTELDRTRADLDAAVASSKRARAQRDFMALTAPADGVIIRRDGEIGQFLPSGQALFYLSCCAPLRVSADVDEEDIARVHLAQKVLLKADAVPNHVFDGEVGEITPKGDPVARSYRVRIKLSDPALALLKVGMTVDANLIVAQHERALLLPATAVKDGKIWLLANGRLHQQAVQTGIVGNVRTEITAGLDEQAQVAAAPDDTLREGRLARAKPAPAGAASAASAAAAH